MNTRWPDCWGQSRCRSSRTQLISFLSPGRWKVSSITLRGGSSSISAGAILHRPRGNSALTSKGGSMSFENRVDAGRKLAKALSDYKRQQPVILALPRGGVLVAAEIAAAFNAPLDLVLVRKIGVPFQPEL